MNFQRIGSFAGLATLTCLLFLSSQAWAEKVDDDMPPPQDKLGSELPLGEAPSQEVGGMDDALPNPSLGEEALPEPAEERGREKNKNLVNKTPEEDDIFLPTPAVNDNINYAPVGTPPSGRVTAEDLDWRSSQTNRPMFMLHGGFNLRNYASTLVTNNPFGYQIGASLRLLSLGQTIFFHGMGSVGWAKLGDVGPYSDVQNRTIRLGGMLEIGLGRRFSLYGSLLRRTDMITSEPTSDSVLNAQRDLRYLANVGEAPAWLLGAGVQYDFWVVPHGSMGAMLHLERDSFLFLLTMAVEPAPRKKINVNFNDIGE